MILQTPHYWKPEYPEYYSAAGWELEKQLAKQKMSVELKANRIFKLIDQVMNKLIKIDFGKDHERFETLTAIAHRLLDLHKRTLCNKKLN